MKKAILIGLALVVAAFVCAWIYFSGTSGPSEEAFGEDTTPNLAR